MKIPGLALNVDAEAVPWRPTRSPGVDWFIVWSDPEAAEERGSARGAVVLIRMQPGCGYPPHKHVGPEEVLVMQGGYRDVTGTYETGAFVRYPAGSTHAPVANGDKERPTDASNPACILFASAHAGIEPL